MDTSQLSLRSLLSLKPPARAVFDCENRLQTLVDWEDLPPGSIEVRVTRGGQASLAGSNSDDRGPLITISRCRRFGPSQSGSFSSFPDSPLSFYVKKIVSLNYSLGPCRREEEEEGEDEFDEDDSKAPMAYFVLEQDAVSTSNPLSLFGGGGGGAADWSIFKQVVSKEAKSIRRKLRGGGFRPLSKPAMSFLQRLDPELDFSETITLETVDAAPTVLRSSPTHSPPSDSPLDPRSLLSKDSLFFSNAPPHHVKKKLPYFDPLLDDPEERELLLSSSLVRVRFNSNEDLIAFASLLSHLTSDNSTDLHPRSIVPGVGGPSEKILRRPTWKRSFRRTAGCWYFDTRSENYLEYADKLQDWKGKMAEYADRRRMNAAADLREETTDLGFGLDFVSKKREDQEQGEGGEGGVAEERPRGYTQKEYETLADLPFFWAGTMIGKFSFCSQHSSMSSNEGEKTKEENSSEKKTTDSSSSSSSSLERLILDVYLEDDDNDVMTRRFLPTPFRVKSNDSIEILDVRMRSKEEDDNDPTRSLEDLARIHNRSFFVLKSTTLKALEEEELIQIEEEGKRRRRKRGRKRRRRRQRQRKKRRRQRRPKRGTHQSVRSSTSDVHQSFFQNSFRATREELERMGPLDDLVDDDDDSEEEGEVGGVDENEVFSTRDTSYLYIEFEDVYEMARMIRFLQVAALLEEDRLGLSPGLRKSRAFRFERQSFMHEGQLLMARKPLREILVPLSYTLFQWMALPPSTNPRDPYISHFGRLSEGEETLRNDILHRLAFGLFPLGSSSGDDVTTPPRPMPTMTDLRVHIDRVTELYGVTELPVKFLVSSRQESRILFQGSGPWLEDCPCPVASRTASETNSVAFDLQAGLVWNTRLLVDVFGQVAKICFDDSLAYRFTAEGFEVEGVSDRILSAIGSLGLPAELKDQVSRIQDRMRLADAGFRTFVYDTLSARRGSSLPFQAVYSDAFFWLEQLYSDNVVFMNFVPFRSHEQVDAFATMLIKTNPVFPVHYPRQWALLRAYCEGFARQEGDFGCCMFHRLQVSGIVASTAAVSLRSGLDSRRESALLHRSVAEEFVQAGDSLPEVGDLSARSALLRDLITTTRDDLPFHSSAHVHYFVVDASSYSEELVTRFRGWRDGDYRRWLQNSVALRGKQLLADPNSRLPERFDGRSCPTRAAGVDRSVEFYDGFIDLDHVVSQGSVALPHLVSPQIILADAVGRSMIHFLLDSIDAVERRSLFAHRKAVFSNDESFCLFYVSDVRCVPSGLAPPDRKSVIHVEFDSAYDMARWVRQFEVALRVFEIDAVPPEEKETFRSKFAPLILPMVTWQSKLADEERGILEEGDHVLVALYRKLVTTGLVAAIQKTAAFLDTDPLWNQWTFDDEDEDMKRRRDVLAFMILFDQRPSEYLRSLVEVSDDVCSSRFAEDVRHFGSEDLESMNDFLEKLSDLRAQFIADGASVMTDFSPDFESKLFEVEPEEPEEEEEEGEQELPASLPVAAPPTPVESLFSLFLDAIVPFLIELCFQRCNPLRVIPIRYCRGYVHENSSVDHGENCFIPGRDCPRCRARYYVAIRNLVLKWNENGTCSVKMMQDHDLCPSRFVESRLEAPLFQRRDLVLYICGHLSRYVVRTFREEQRSQFPPGVVFPLLGAAPMPLSLRNRHNTLISTTKATGSLIQVVDFSARALGGLSTHAAFKAALMSLSFPGLDVTMPNHYVLLTTSEQMNQMLSRLRDVCPGFSLRYARVWGFLKTVGLVLRSGEVDLCQDEECPYGLQSVYVEEAPKVQARSVGSIARFLTWPDEKSVDSPSKPKLSGSFPELDEIHFNQVAHVSFFVFRDQTDVEFDLLRSEFVEWRTVVERWLANKVLVRGKRTPHGSRNMAPIRMDGGRPSGHASFGYGTMSCVVVSG